MIVLQTSSRLRTMIVLIPLVLMLMDGSGIGTQETVSVTEITPEVLVFVTTAGNVLASVGPDGALLVGTLSIASTSSISDIVARRTKSTVRYVVIGPLEPARSEGDAGWVRRGAFVAMHENALQVRRQQNGPSVTVVATLYAARRRPPAYRLL